MKPGAISSSGQRSSCERKRCTRRVTGCGLSDWGLLSRGSSRVGSDSPGLGSTPWASSTPRSSCESLGRCTRRGSGSALRCFSTAFRLATVESEAGARARWPGRVGSAPGSGSLPPACSLLGRERSEHVLERRAEGPQRVNTVCETRRYLLQRSAEFVRAQRCTRRVTGCGLSDWGYSLADRPESVPTHRGSGVCRCVSSPDRSSCESLGRCTRRGSGSGSPLVWYSPSLSTVAKRMAIEKQRRAEPDPRRVHRPNDSHELLGVLETQGVLPSPGESKPTRDESRESTPNPLRPQPVTRRVHRLRSHELRRPLEEIAPGFTSRIHALRAFGPPLQDMLAALASQQRARWRERPTAGSRHNMARPASPRYRTATPGEHAGGRDPLPGADATGPRQRARARRRRRARSQRLRGGRRGPGC